MTDFPHASRPGHYGIAFDATLKQALSVLVTALVPGDETYPSAADAQVVEFIESRSSTADEDVARRVVAGCAHDTADAASAALVALEKEQPDDFAWLRDFTYFGYYASRRVLAAMADRGYAYHGAPQPLGYAIAEEMQVPSAARGVFILTEEVTRAAL